MYWFAIAVLLATTPLASFADSLPLKDGRYPRSVLEFDLTDEQKQIIDRFRTCHIQKPPVMNFFTPYVFKLTPNQARAVQARAGFSPALFQVYETYRGFNDAGPHWNLVLRYSEGRIEVPLDLLLPDSKANQAHAVQGWKPFNPCFPDIKPN